MSTFGNARPVDFDAYQPIQRQVRRLFRQPSSAAQLIELAYRIYSWSPVSKDFTHSLGVYLSAAGSVAGTLLPDTDESHRNAANATASHLQSALAWAYVMHMPLNRQWFRQLTEQHKLRKQRIARAAPFSAEWRTETTKAQSIELLTGTYLERLNAVETIRSEYRRKLIFPQTPAGRSLINTIDEAIGRLKKGQRKAPTCVMRDGFLHSQGSCWVFRDGESLFSQLPSQFKPGVRVPVIIGSFTEFDRIKSTNMSIEVDPDRPVYGYSRDYPETTSIAVHNDGYVAVDTTFGMYSLQRAYEEAGVSEHFALAWWTHLLRAIDLTTSELVRRKYNLRQWPTLPPRNADLARYKREIEEGFVEQFWVPQQQILRDRLSTATRSGHTVVSLTDDNSSVRDQAGYLQRLAPGKRARQSARDAYREDHGRELPDDMTYVKRHPHRYRDPLIPKSGIREAKRRPRQIEE